MKKLLNYTDIKIMKQFFEELNEIINHLDNFDKLDYIEQTKHIIDDMISLIESRSNPNVLVIYNFIKTLNKDTLNKLSNEYLTKTNRIATYARNIIDKYLCDCIQHCNYIKEDRNKFDNMTKEELIDYIKNKNL